MKQILVAVLLCTVFVNAYAWGHRASSGGSSHGWGNIRRR